MLRSYLLAHMGVVEAKFVTAVVAYSHGGRAQPNDLDLVRMAAVTRVRVVTPVDGHQGRPHDRVWTVRTHGHSIGIVLVRFNTPPLSG